MDNDGGIPDIVYLMYVKISEDGRIVGTEIMHDVTDQLITDGHDFCYTSQIPSKLLETGAWYRFWIRKVYTDQTDYVESNNIDRKICQSVLSAYSSTDYVYNEVQVIHIMKDPSHSGIIHSPSPPFIVLGYNDYDLSDLYETSIVDTTNTTIVGTGPHANLINMWPWYNGYTGVGGELQCNRTYMLRKKWTKACAGIGPRDMYQYYIRLSDDCPPVPIVGSITVSDSVHFNYIATIPLTNNNNSYTVWLKMEREQLYTANRIVTVNGANSEGYIELTSSFKNMDNLIHQVILEGSNIKLRNLENTTYIFRLRYTETGPESDELQFEVPQVGSASAGAGSGHVVVGAFPPTAPIQASELSESSSASTTLPECNFDIGCCVSQCAPGITECHVTEVEFKLFSHASHSLQKIVTSPFNPSGGGPILFNNSEDGFRMNLRYDDIMESLPNLGVTNDNYSGRIEIYYKADSTRCDTTQTGEYFLLKRVTFTQSSSGTLYAGQSCDYDGQCISGNCEIPYGGNPSTRICRS